MGVLFLIVFFFVSFLIVGLVLLQEGKGGGLTGMSTGMDGVMGAKNPLRRMTAWLFVFFVLLTISINWYFYSRGDTSIPEGIELPKPAAIEETAPATGPVVVPAPETPAETGGAALPVPPDADAATPATNAAAPSAPAESAPAAPTADASAPSAQPAEPKASE